MSPDSPASRSSAVSLPDAPQVVWRGPVPYQPGLEGRYPGQESVLRLSGTDVEMRLCWCPPGDDVAGFWIAKHPVSRAQWTAVMGNDPSESSTGPDCPVDSVSWDDAQKFCKKTGLRLPSEKEWEYACRAGTTTDFAVGEGVSLNSQLANFDGRYPWGDGVSKFNWAYRERTLPEGSFPPNAWGLHDMHGQLWEWCEDELPGGGRVLRGGSWINLGRLAASGRRLGFVPGDRDDGLGFRPCPRSISSQQEGPRRGRGARQVKE